MNYSSTLAGIRPVFYIDANTEFDSGNGSKSNPYIILPTISFTITNLFTSQIDTYYAKQGMTWGQWMNSIYNINGWVYSNPVNIGPDQRIYDSRNECVYTSDIITSSNYNISTTGPC